MPSFAGLLSWYLNPPEQFKVASNSCLPNRTPTKGRGRGQVGREGGGHGWGVRQESRALLPPSWHHRKQSVMLHSGQVQADKAAK